MALSLSTCGWLFGGGGLCLLQPTPHLCIAPVLQAVACQTCLAVCRWAYLQPQWQRGAAWTTARVPTRRPWSPLAARGLDSRAACRLGSGLTSSLLRQGRAEERGWTTFLVVWHWLVSAGLALLLHASAMMVHGSAAMIQLVSRRAARASWDLSL